ncbi:MAG: NfeD family protein [Epsilonproteobacteria bacterium]|nr:MAG: NfeD family protein [Campylobacterota bacterium]
MVAFLNETVLWWHWIVFGIFLLILELGTGTFLLLGLSIAAVLVGMLDAFLDTSFAVELSIWMILSIVAIGVWVKWFRVQAKTDSGQSRYSLDTLGIVTEDIPPNSRGKVTFDSPVLGNTSWHATAKTLLKKQTRVKIVEINGQLIEVETI